MKHPLHVFSLILAASTFILLIAGGLVTSNDAGLAVPDWPLSYGMWMPPMVGGIFYEHGHRMVAATVGFMTLLLCGALFLSRAPAWMRGLGLTAVGTVILQGILGGLTVRYQLPLGISVFHACLAQIFFCLTVSLALFSSPAWARGWEIPSSLDAGVRFRATLLTAALLLQLVFGALLRHTGMVDGTKAGRLVVWVLVAHIVGALIVSVLAAGVGITLLGRFKEGLLYQAGAAVLVLLLMQLAFGVSSLWVRIKAVDRIQPMPVDVWITTSHLAIGALMLAVSLVITLCLKRGQPHSQPTRPATEAR